jgi:uncharacterized membrane protein
MSILNNLAHSNIGWLHIIFSLASLWFGTLILVKTKGTYSHKRIGYLYVVAMLGVNMTAFLIYHLFNRFGPFHIAAVISSLTLFSGMIPVLFRKHIKAWFNFHMSFMYYSVIGLYAAFASEVIVRIPGIRFWWSVLAATMVVMVVAMVLFRKLSARWIAKFGN